MKKKGLFFLAACLLLPGIMHGQQITLLDDTLRLDEVIVRGRPVLSSAGFNRIKVDSSLLLDNFNLSVSDILRKGTPLFIKSYGPGGISTVSLRGAGSSHTIVTWNGLNLNSPSLGQADFLLIPATAADEITICNGGASVAIAQGGLGGVIDIGTKPLWNTSFSHDMAVAAGGYGRYSASYIGRYGAGNWRFASRLNYNRAANDFVYENSYLTGENISERRANASFLQKAFIQEAWYKSATSVTGIKLWLQESIRDIPVPINVSQSSHDEKLDNNIFRALLSHDRYFAGEIALFSSAGIQSESLIYRDNVTGLFSESHQEIVTINSSLYSKPAEKISMKASLVSESGFFQNSNYENGRIFRNLTGWSVAADYIPAGNVSLNANTTMSLQDGKLIPPDLSAGIEVSPPKNNNLVLKANIAAKSRVPSLNDLYWDPGGNPDLLAERGYNGEIALNFSHDFSTSLNLSFNSSVYVNSIHNMIIWLPGSSGVWTPRNNGDILARGIESEFLINWKSGTGNIRLLICHTLTHSVDREEGHQLIYVPEQMAYSELRATSGPFIAGTSLHCTGRRYITTDNSQYLPSYTLTEGWAGIRTMIHGQQVDVTARFENIFNVAYQTMAYHPMPPGSIIINMAVHFKPQGEK